MYIFIGVHVLKVDHGAKSPEEAPFIERFQRSGPSVSQASGLISPKRSFNASDTLNFIKREKSHRHTHRQKGKVDNDHAADDRLHRWASKCFLEN